MSDEQRVRTMAGWIGVEISKSRVRTPGKAGYGLYRVRGYRLDQQRDRGASRIRRPETVAVPCAWTPYAFRLAAIELGVEVAVRTGDPGAPGPLVLPVEPAGPRDTEWVSVPTRWTSAYRGPRTLGVPAFAGVRSAVRTEVCRALSVRVSEAMTTAERDEQGSAQMLNRSYLRAKYGIETDTPRARQRAQNAAFQAEHLRRREWGLRQRHRRKLMDNRRRDNGEVPPAR